MVKNAANVENFVFRNCDLPIPNVRFPSSLVKFMLELRTWDAFQRDMPWLEEHRWFNWSHLDQCPNIQRVHIDHFYTILPPGYERRLNLLNCTNVTKLCLLTSISRYVVSTAEIISGPK